MPYRRRIPVEFNHCDPHGIVFYPRYFEMTNSLVENFFREEIGYPFARLMAEGLGVPTVRIEMEFRSPSRLGEVLDWTLAVLRVGGSSARLRVEARGDGRLRLGGETVLVFAAKEGGARAWPEQVRSLLDGLRQRDLDEPA
jgi:4-hydroxybenzoyl-CoA thioesterase